MEIKRYEPWMKLQVIDLFVKEYSVDPDSFETLFERFYDHPFQADRCVRIVSVEGEIVAGFQSFFFWPLVEDGKEIKALQSGNSLVHPDFRGQRLFARMLDFIHQPDSGIVFDILIGFPVEASYNSFIRNKWLNPFDLKWYIKLMSPVRSIFRSGDFGEKHRRNRFGLRPGVFPEHVVHAGHSDAFESYRANYQTDQYFRFAYSENGNEAVFETKIRKRKKYFSELIIGNVIVSSRDQAWIARAIELLETEVKKSGRVTFLSIAVNPLSSEWTAAMNVRKFKALDRKIHFIAKGPLAETIKDWSGWWLFRGDIDTW
jgi:hypothetical protein